MAMAAVPPGIEIAAVRRFLAGRPGVASLHDLHVWPLSTTETALTVHLVMPGGHPGDAALMACCAELRTRFGIGHATLQVETDAGTRCALAPEGVV
jgi:cobalt-zinc-cadmium efflux system protein